MLDGVGKYQTSKVIGSLNIHDGLKAKNELFSVRFVFECFPSLSLDKGRLFRQ